MKFLSNKSEIFIRWDITNWSQSIKFWKIKSSVNLSHCMGLELGAAQGGLSLWLANEGCHVICSDIDKSVFRAREIHDTYQLKGNISYVQINTLTIPFNQSIDVIVFKSLLGGVGRNNMYVYQKKAIDEMYHALKPGGELCFAENLVASPVHRFFRKRFVQWGESWRYVSIDEMQELLSQFTEVNLKTTGFAGAFGRTE